MPRARTEEERARIRQRLAQVGRDAFVRLGLAKVTIEELARGAGIGKGTFYQFFDSKEALFMAILDAEEAAFKASLRAELERAPTARDAVRSLLLAAATRLEEHPFLKLLVEPDTVATLMLRLDPQVLEDNQRRDRDFFESLAADWKARGWLLADVDSGRVFDVVAAMFALSLQRELVGPESFRGAVDEIVDSVSARWTEAV